MPSHGLKAVRKRRFLICNVLIILLMSVCISVSYNRIHRTLFRITLFTLFTLRLNSRLFIVKKHLYQYHLPSAFNLILEPPNKETWKKPVTKAVHQYHEKELKSQAATQSTCRYINLDPCSVTKPHPVWQTALSYPREVNRACLKVKIQVFTTSKQSNQYSRMSSAN